MVRYHVAAVVSVLVGILDILLLFLAMGAGILEGLAGLRAPGLVLTIAIAATYLLTIYVYLILGSHLRPTGIVWPVIALIALCVLGIVLAGLESAAFFSDAESLVVHSVSLVPYGLALLALSVQLLRARRRHPSANLLYTFAVCNLITAVLTLTVILAPFAYVPAVLSSFLLAGAFFRIGRGPGADTGDAAPGKLADGGLYLVLLMSIGLLALLALEFAQLYHLPWRLTGRQVWLGPSIAGLAGLQAIGLGVLLRRYFSSGTVAGSLNWVAGGTGVWLCYLLAQHWLVDRVDSALQKLLAGFVLGKGGSVFFSVVLGSAWLYAFITLTDRKAGFNGYREIFLAGALAAAIGYLLVFPDTLRLLGLATICVATIGLVFSIRTGGKTGVFFLNPWKQVVVLAVALVLPTTAYLANHAKTWAALGVMLTELVTTERTAMRRILEDADPTAFLPSHATLVSAAPIFDDVWFIDGRRAYAVNDEHLYFRDSDTAPWQAARVLSTTRNLVRFDDSGQRGWVGSPWGPVEITEDGGTTWRAMDPENVFGELAGREFGSNLLDGQSKLYLNPATGDGTFVMACRHFRTDDFAYSWQMREFKRQNGKRLCVAESPFAVNHTATALIGVTLGEEVFYQRQTENDPWEAVCAVEDGALFVLPTTPCSAGHALSAEEHELLSNHENEWSVLQIESLPQDVRHAVLHNHGLLEESLRGLVRRNAMRAWLVDRGTLMHKDTGTDTWLVEAHIPKLVRVIPLSETQAIGWDLALQIYASDDGGSVWRPVPVLANTVSDDYVIRIQPDPLKQGLWVLSGKGLYFLPYHAEPPRRQLTATDDEWLSMFGTSPAGTIIWVYTQDGSRLRLSADQGETWHVVHLIRYLAERDEYANLTHASCLDTGLCYLLFDDGALTEATLHSGTVRRTHRPIGTLPETVAATGGYLMAGSSGEVLLFVPEQGSDAYRSLDRGKSWRRLSLGVDGYWSTPERFRSADSFFLPGAEEAVIIPGLLDEWLTINPWSWNDEMHYCWDTATETLYLFNDENLAMSLDSGQSWQRNDEPLRHPPFCGINNGFLWLNHRGMQVFRLPGPVIPP